MLKASEIPRPDGGSDDQTWQIRTETRKAVEDLAVDERGYADVEVLREILLQELKGKKFILDCGHRITFGHPWGNDITIRNGVRPKIICSLCGYLFFFLLGML